MVEPKGNNFGWNTDSYSLSPSGYAQHVIGFQHMDQADKLTRQNMNQHEKNQLKQPDPVGFSCMVTPGGTGNACRNEWKILGEQCQSPEYAWTMACNAKEIFDYSFTQWYAGWSPETT